MSDDLLHRLLIQHEGERLKPYRCTAGKLTIGVGRNLDDLGISREESRFLLANDIARVEAEARAALPWVDRLDPVRRAVVLDMLFNMGLGRFGGFRKMLAAVERGDWPAAAAEMLDSVWARQVGGRAVELAAMMRTGREA